MPWPIVAAVGFTCIVVSLLCLARIWSVDKNPLRTRRVWTLVALIPILGPLLYVIALYTTPTNEQIRQELCKQLEAAIEREPDDAARSLLASKLEALSRPLT